MNKFRSHWLALFGGVALIVLSMSTALGAKPDAGENRGQQVSAFVHSLQGDVEETDEQGDEETEGTDEETEGTDEETEGTDEETEGTDEDTEGETEDETDVEVQDSESSAHGECVREVAKDPEAVGGENENHGGAVSLAARETCRDEEGAAADSEESAADETEASTKVHGRGKGHGKGHNR